VVRGWLSKHKVSDLNLSKDRVSENIKLYKRGQVDNLWAKILTKLWYQHYQAKLSQHIPVALS